MNTRARASLSVHHHDLTFPLHYASTERFVLPLSHDEVVHEKGSILTRMPGDRWQQLANVRALYGWMWAHPGKKLLFMGGELAQEAEWDHDRSLDWHLLADPGHQGVQDLVRDLNRLYRSRPSLWASDADPSTFAWLVGDDPDQNVAAFWRGAGRSGGRRQLFARPQARLVVATADLRREPGAVHPHHARF